MNEAERTNQDLLNKATAAALLASSECFVGNAENATAFIEHVIEAATARVFLDLHRERARRERAAALEVLAPDLCGECVELNGHALDLADGWTPAAVDGERPGDAELAERAMFLDWSGRCQELHGEGGDPGDPRGQRGGLVAELHASIGERHPLGLARHLSLALGELADGDDKAAARLLEDLADDELKAARNEKAAACGGATIAPVDAEADPEKIEAEVTGWTLGELDAFLAWADDAADCVAAGARPPLRVIEARILTALAADEDLAELRAERTADDPDA